MKKLAIVTTHPIQYYAPLFQLLHQSKQIDIKVFYTWGEGAFKKYDPGFGKIVDWDVDLLTGYPYEWLKNTSAKPGSHSFNGIVNPDIIERIESWQPDALLIYGWAYKSHLKCMRYFKNKIPVYFRGDSTLLDNKPGLKGSLKSVFLKWVYKHVDYAFYTGTNNKQYFKKYGLADTQLIYAPHTVDNDRFSVSRADEAAILRQSIDVNDSDILVLFAGKFEQKKSPQILLDAFLSLKKDHVHLLFVGDGKLEKPLKQNAMDQKNVHFMPFQNQSYMPVIYQGCDIFCLPSQGPGETWGLAVNEAMASGKTVLVSDKVGCALDLVLPGFTGMIFKAGEISDLTAKLSLLAEDKNHLAVLGSNAKNHIASWNFNKQVTAIISAITANNEK
jgi:glycosyltransferase involved in cell wall biosynthesis